MPDLTRCAFCGHPDAHHRLRDAVVDRFLADESLGMLVLDYAEQGVPLWAQVEQIGDLLRQGVRERLRQTEDPK